MNRTFSTQSNRFSYTGESIRKITRDEVLVLRAVNARRLSARVVLDAVAALLSDIGSLFVPRTPQKTNSMCRYYGHVIQGSWQGSCPNCADCGIKITSPDQLRKAAPRA